MTITTEPTPRLILDLHPGQADYIRAAQAKGIDIATLLHRTIYNIINENSVASQIAEPGEDFKRYLDGSIHDNLRENSVVLPPFTDERRSGAIALLQQWEDEAANYTAEEIGDGEADIIEMKRNMNANRAATGERLVFP